MHLTDSERGRAAEVLAGVGEREVIAVSVGDQGAVEGLGEGELAGSCCSGWGECIRSMRWC